MFKKKLASPGVSELLCVGGIAVKEQISALQHGVGIVERGTRLSSSVPVLH